MQIEGLGKYGYTAQAVMLARHLYRNEDARAEMRKLLDLIEQPHRYSNEDFDRRQHIADSITTMIRKQATISETAA